MLGFGRAAREVCALALRCRRCFCHLASAKYECDAHIFFANQKLQRGARIYFSRLLGEPLPSQVSWLCVFEYQWLARLRRLRREMRRHH